MIVKQVEFLQNKLNYTILKRGYKIILTYEYISINEVVYNYCLTIQSIVQKLLHLIGF